jgi:hypothetical protein
MIDIVFFVILLVTPPTTTHCDIYLDEQGQTYEICRPGNEPVIVSEPDLRLIEPEQLPMS